MQEYFTYKFKLNDMNVYKYRYGSKRDLESLKQDYFYAPHPSKLNDPCENSFDAASVEKTLAQLSITSSISTKALSEHLSALLVQIQKNVGIYSLSKTVLDELLWSHYADSHTGFCIEYDFEKLGELTKCAGAFNVIYQDSVPEIAIDIFFKNDEQQVHELLKLTSGTKSKKWAYEDEIRIIMDHFGRVDYDFRAVKAIYFGLNMPKTQQDLPQNNQDLPDYFSKVTQAQVMELLRGRNIKYYQMALKSNSYEFEYIEVIDPHKDVDKYMNTVKYIDKSCIDYCGYSWMIDPSYFDKVAEIIRRELYFYKLNSIHISKEKSIERSEPVIFSGFFKAENDWIQVKRYFSLDDIDKIYNDLSI
ncbi:DUF2971 domain-containing protein [Acinetobacter sp. MD2(2019)]|uniref:DUF2971 domain-containing protein n=1 Tax=Acinetobacter sp. MD2(2019) TaxID=2605273 RepID=UPI002D1E6E5F|nr:DUF2971 domain-containing protein [Acinetobacter sp. MD2(2019)]MEB3754083.1 DUF2971 domain-containing protein [Acinetobacter sp. MD2(2019)]